MLRDSCVLNMCIYICVLKCTVRFTMKDTWVHIYVYKYIYRCININTYIFVQICMHICIYIEVYDMIHERYTMSPYIHMNSKSMQFTCVQESLQGIADYARERAFTCVRESLQGILETMQVWVTNYIHMRNRLIADYGVATVSRIDSIIGLLCRILSFL